MKRTYVISREALKENLFSEAKKTITGLKKKDRDIDLIVKILKKLS